MPPATASSNIRAFVQWREPSVYAGEEIDCIITFKNIAAPSHQTGNSRDSRKPSANGDGPGRSYPPSSPGHSRKSSFAHRPLPPSRTASVSAVAASAAAAAAGRGNLQGRGHRPALSLNVIGGSSRGGGGGGASKRAGDFEAAA